MTSNLHSTPLDDALSRYLDYYTSLTLETVHRLDAHAAPELHFRDPFNDVRGVETVVRILTAMLHGAPGARFVIDNRSRQDHTAYVKWRFLFPTEGSRWFNGSVIEGVSEIHLNAQGRIVAHFDYWDAASTVYERIPLLGALLRLIKRRVSAAHH